MKIGIIAPYDVLTLNNGASVRVYELAKNLNANGASVCVLHHGQAKSFSPTFKFLHFRALSLLPGSSNYLHPLNIAYYFALIRFLREFQPDIVQCEGPWSMFPTLFIARRFNIPCVLDEHNVEFLWSLNVSKVPLMAPSVFALEKIAVASSALILSTSEIDKKLLQKCIMLIDKK